MGFDAVLLAGGSSTRFGQNNPKLLADLNGTPVLGHSLLRLQRHPQIKRIVVVCHKDLLETIKTTFSEKKYGPYRLISGGKSRGHSVQNGLQLLNGSEWVVIHDGARPLWCSTNLNALMESTQANGPALLTAPCTDTLKKIDENGLVTETPLRELMVRALTPQAFPYEIILDAYQRGLEQGVQGTDCASYAEWAGHQVHTVQGESWNIKLTTASDLPVLSRLFEEHEKELLQ